MYAYDALLNCYAEAYRVDPESAGLGDVEDEDVDPFRQAAIENVDFNTVRSLPYMGPRAPIVVHEFSEDDKWWEGGAAYVRDSLRTRERPSSSDAARIGA